MTGIAVLTKPGERFLDDLVMPGSLEEAKTRLVCGPRYLGSVCSFTEPHIVLPEGGRRYSQAYLKSQIQGLNEAGSSSERMLVQGIEEFGSDIMLGIANIVENLQVGAETGFKSLINTVSGHIAGSASTIQSNTSGILEEIAKVNAALYKYANTHNHSKHVQKINVQNAYKALQNKFNFIAEKTVSAYKTGRQSALLSVKRGITVAERYQHRVLPLQTLPEVKSLTKTLSAAKYVAGVGMVLDVGLRIDTVQDAFSGPFGSKDRGMKTAFEEVFGFGAALFATPIFLGEATAVLCIVMGPFGLVPAIVLAGGVGIGADYLGRGFGRMLAELAKDAGMW